MSLRLAFGRGPSPVIISGTSGPVHFMKSDKQLALFSP